MLYKLKGEKYLETPPAMRGIVKGEWGFLHRKKTHVKIGCMSLCLLNDKKISIKIYKHVLG